MLHPITLQYITIPSVTLYIVLHGQGRQELQCIVIHHNVTQDITIHHNVTQYITIPTPM